MLKRIEHLENLRLEYYSEILEDLRVGRIVNIRFMGMKGRYLEALNIYDSGLTPRELYEKRRTWLWRPGEKMPARIKTVSMLLRRLQLSGLARREKEGHTYRYFLTTSGRRRLDYYKSLTRI